MIYEMNQPVFLICGVPGSGKTWVCEQLKEHCHYIPHDMHFKNHTQVIWEASKTALKPIITEIPFGERLVKEELEAKGLTVKPYFVVIEPETARKQYQKREKKAYPKMFYSRAKTIKSRALEWKAPHGTSQEILGMLISHLAEGIS